MPIPGKILCNVEEFATGKPATLPRNPLHPINAVNRFMAGQHVGFGYSPARALHNQAHPYSGVATQGFVNGQYFGPVTSFKC